MAVTRAPDEIQQRPLHATLTEIESKTIEQFKQLEATEGLSKAEIKAMRQNAAALFGDLRTIFGKDLCLKKPSQLTHEEAVFIREKLAFYNLQIRYFYQGIVGAIIPKNHPGASHLENVCSAHSRKIRALFDACPITPSASLTLQVQPEEKMPEVKSAQSETFYATEFYVWQPRRDYSLFDGFWYWQGFNDGFGNNRPRLFDALVSSRYCQGYWEGRGMDLLVHRAFPAMFEAGKWVGHEVLQSAQGLGHLALRGVQQAGHAALHVGGEVKEASVALAHQAGSYARVLLPQIQSGCQSCGNATCTCLTAVADGCKRCGTLMCDCAHQVLQPCCNSCGNAVCNCLSQLPAHCNNCGDGVCHCANAISSGCQTCGSECGTCACSAAHCVTDGCSGCGQALESCRCNCETNDDAAKGICGCCGVIFTAIGTAVSKFTGSNGSSDTGGHHNSTSTIVTASAGAPYNSSTVFATSTAPFALDGPVLTPFKWLGMVGYGAAFVPNLLVKAYESVSNLYHGRKTTESAVKLGMPLATGGASYGILSVLPLFGGPHVAFMSSLFFGWATWKTVHWQYGKKNLQQMGHEDPDFLLVADALRKLEDQLRTLDSEADPLQIQKNIVQYFEDEIRRERKASYEAQKNSGCLGRVVTSLHRLWGTPYQQNSRLQHLLAAKEALETSNFAVFAEKCHDAGIADLPTLVQSVMPTASAPSAPPEPMRRMSMGNTA